MITKKLHAAYLEKIGKKLQLIKKKVEFNLGDNQLLVKIFYSGVCRSQIMEQLGYRDNHKYLPHFLGHEGSGVVVAKGKKVKKFKIGDNVIVTWINCIGKPSMGGKLHIGSKIINYGPVTTFSNYSVISENKLAKKPNNMTFREAALFGCALSTGCGMVFNFKKIKKKNIIVVLGCGGIGLSILLMLKSMNLRSNIYILDKNLEKLNKIKKFFKEFKIFKSKKKLHNYLLKKHNSLADVCLESAGTVNTIEQGFDLIHSKGSLLFASHPKKNKKIKLDPHQLISGKLISGTWGGSLKPDKDIRKIYNIIKLNLKKVFRLFCKEYNIKNINVAINDVKNNKVFRPLIKMSNEY